MEYLKNISKKSVFFLLLFVTTTILKGYYMNNGGINENIISVIFMHIFLFLFYLSLVRKPNLVILFFIFMAMLVDVFLSIDHMSKVAVFFLCVYRTVFVWEILKSKEVKLTKKYFKNNSAFYVLILLFIVEVFLLYIHSNDSNFFRLSIVFETILFILIFLAFMKLLKTFKRGNIEFFLAITIFLTSDVIFGGYRLTETNNSFLVLELILYNISYCLIIISDIKSHHQLLNRVPK